MVALENSKVQIDDEPLPALEMAITPFKLSDKIKIDFFSLSEDFLEFAASRGVIPAGDNKDVLIVPVRKAATLILNLKALYHTFILASKKEEVISNAHV